MKGFKEGFKVEVRNFTPSLVSQNHPSAVGNCSVVDDLINKELELKRVAGPFDSPPLYNFHVSPLGLVPKSDGSYRLIHDLSAPAGASVNEAIPREFATVEYETLDHALDLVLRYGKDSLIAKTDFKEAYRVVPIHPDSVHLLGFKWRGKFYYDRCLPFGITSAPLLYETISTAFQWILTQKFGVPSVSHILDDYMFFGPAHDDTCLVALTTFQHVANVVGLPVKTSKTVRPSTNVILHGILVDTTKMEIRLPDDKLGKAITSVQALLSKEKVKLKELQSAIGFLAFVCKVVMPGRTFLRRLYDLTRGVSKPHHYVRINSAAKLDLKVWKHFLNHYNGVSILARSHWIASPKLHLQTDAAGACRYAAVLGSRWVCGAWPEEWRDVPIALKELYPICLAMELWGEGLANKCIQFWCDNEAVCFVINKRSSRDLCMMQLLRRMVVTTMSNNIMFRCRHVRSADNGLADALSRFQFERARELGPELDDATTPVPTHLLPGNILQATF